LINELPAKDTLKMYNSARQTSDVAGAQISLPDSKLTEQLDDQRSARPLVISMGLNGYQWKWKRAVASHREYCRKHEYDYVFVQKPSFTPLKMESAWLKLPLIISALKSKRQWVLFIDCDAVISEDCPPVTSVAQPQKSLFMVNGFSGRVNSGVILIRNDFEIRSLMEKILANALQPVPKEDDVGWGENGHVIQFSKNFSGLQILGTEWNNNQNPDLKDYIRHYSAGPMRQHYHFTIFELTVAKLAKVYSRILGKLQGPSDNQLFYDRLATLMNTILVEYPALK
jgi:hypothetical protein